MLRKFRVLILLALATLGWNVTPAYSTTLTQYTDLASFDAATSGDLTADFEAMTPGYYDSPTGVSYYPNVDFIGYNSVPAPYLQVIDTTGSPYYDFGTGNALEQQMNRPTVGSPPLPYIQVVFSTPVTAFGANLFTANSPGMNFAITLYGASNTQLGTPLTAATNSLPTPAFWGVTSDTLIYSADFTVQGTTAQEGTLAFMDNFTYGTAQDETQTPEAATMLLIGSGLLGLVILGKKMRPVQPA
jgi:hypothetical protein